MTSGPSSPATLPLSSLPVLSFQLPPHLAHLSHLAQDGSSSPIVLQHAGEEVTFVDIDGQLSSDSRLVENVFFSTFIIRYWRLSVCKEKKSEFIVKGLRYKISVSRY